MAENEGNEALETLAAVATASRQPKFVQREGEAYEDFNRRRNRGYNAAYKKRQKDEREKMRSSFDKHLTTVNATKKPDHLTFIYEMCLEMIESGYRDLAARVREMDILRVNIVSIWQHPKFVDCRMEKSLNQRKQKIPEEFELERRFRIMVRNRKDNTWHELFEVKKSSIEGAGDGLFALRSFEKGECVGLYVGEVRSCSHRKTIYSMLFKDDGRLKIMDPGLAPPGRSEQRLPVYFGLQFCNDPNWQQEETELKRTRKKRTKRSREKTTKRTKKATKRTKRATRRTKKGPEANIIVNPNLTVLTTRKINVGDEIFLDYNMDDEDGVLA